MFAEKLQGRIYTVMKQCRQLLELADRDRMMFHDGCQCGADLDEDDCLSDYDDALSFKLEEAKLSCLSMHEWFSPDGRFIDETIQYEVGELFAFCLTYAKKCSPILARTLEVVSEEMERMVPANPRKRSVVHFASSHGLVTHQSPRIADA